MGVLRGIHHVSLNVSDADVARHFYVDVLGLRAIDRPELPVDGVWLEMADRRQVHLIVAAVPDDRGQHAAFAVDDLDAAIDAVRAHGVTVSDAVPVGDTGVRQAFLADPDGNRLELTQPA